jgi:nicotinamide mononucleotide transporter
MEIFGQPLDYFEIAGTLFGIAGVILVIRKSIFNFPIGILNVTFYAWLFFQSKLYADATLQVIYIALLIYGWIKWSNKNHEEAFHAETTSAKTWLLLSLIFIPGTIIIGSVFKNLTDASLPYLDSMLTAASLIAQWMIAKRKIENWIIWIVADLLYVGMYIYKELYFTSILYFIFVILAIAGYKEWRKVLVR